MDEKAREAGYIRQLKSAPLVVKLIKLADIYDNLNDISNILPGDHPEKTLKQIAAYVAALRNETRAYVKPLREIDRLIRSAKPGVRRVRQIPGRRTTIHVSNDTGRYSLEGKG